MQKKYLIYKHTSPDGKVYIGQTCQRAERRWREGDGYKKCTYFNNSIQKYGWHNFSHDIISEGLILKEANWLESYLIRFYNSDNPEYGYNLTSGGDNTKLSDETRNKMSESRKGKNHWNYGKHWSEEIKQKISNSNLGHTSPNKGKHMSELSKKKISESNKGQHYSVATEFKSREVVQITLQGEFVKEYKTISLAEKEIGMNSGKISAVCRGKRKTAGGFKWMYKEEYYGLI